MGSLKLTTASSGSVILSPANTASDVTITVPASTATMAINGPAFGAYQSVQQTGISSYTNTKVTFDAEEFDTNNNFASSRFTPTVAGYYQINAVVQIPYTNNTCIVQADIFKNGSSYKDGSTNTGNGSTYPSSQISALVYMNGTTDYIEIYVYGSNSGSYNISNAGDRTFVNGYLARAA